MKYRPHILARRNRPTPGFNGPMLRLVRKLNGVGRPPRHKRALLKSRLDSMGDRT